MTYSLYQLGMSSALSAEESAELAARVASLAGSGLPLEAGLLALADELPGRQRVLRNLSARMSRGESFEQASQAADARLPATLRALVAAGIRSGRLPQVLEEYVSLARRQQTYRQRASLVLLYPALLMCMMAVLSVYGRFALSDLYAIFSDFHTKLPDFTVLVFRFLPYNMWVMIDLAAVTCLAATMPMLPGKVWPFSAIVEYLPIVGAMVRYRRLAAACELLAMLLENEVPAPAALELAAAASESAPLAAGLSATAESVRQGAPLHQALAMWELPARLARLVEWGQQSADLPGVFRAAADSYESQLQTQRQILEAVVGPLFFLFMLFAVGVVVVAFMLPLLSMMLLLRGFM
jgi:general secretion pathway protein F